MVMTAVAQNPNPTLLPTISRAFSTLVAALDPALIRKGGFAAGSNSNPNPSPSRQGVVVTRARRNRVQIPEGRVADSKGREHNPNCSSNPDSMVLTAHVWHDGSEQQASPLGLHLVPTGTQPAP